MKLYAGDQVNHYTLLEPLGAGGQGSVWKVLDPRGGGVERALKIIQLDESKPWAFDRARREAKILSFARHPALVACHGLFEEPNGVIGLLMDLVKGEPLDDLIASERLDPACVAAVLEQLAEALAYLHAEGLSHRDIKPADILLTDAFYADPRRPGTGATARAASSRRASASGAEARHDSSNRPCAPGSCSTSMTGPPPSP